MGSSGSVPTSEIVSYIQKSPISILDWEDESLLAFSKCFKALKVDPGKEVSCHVRVHMKYGKTIACFEQGSHTALTLPCGAWD